MYGGMKSGYLYVISNENFPDWIKIGVTENLEKRLNQYQTASPFRNYKLEYSLHHPKYLEAEKRIKETIKPFAKSIRNEWFEISIPMAKSRLDEVLESYNNGEWV